MDLNLRKIAAYVHDQCIKDGLTTITPYSHLRTPFSLVYPTVYEYMLLFDISIDDYAGLTTVESFLLFLKFLKLYSEDVAPEPKCIFQMSMRQCLKIRCCCSGQYSEDLISTKRICLSLISSVSASTVSNEVQIEDSSEIETSFMSSSKKDNSEPLSAKEELKREAKVNRRRKVSKRHTKVSKVDQCYTVCSSLKVERSININELNAKGLDVHSIRERIRRNPIPVIHRTVIHQFTHYTFKKVEYLHSPIDRVSGLSSHRKKLLYNQLPYKEASIVTHPYNYNMLESFANELGFRLIPCHEDRYHRKFGIRYCIREECDCKDQIKYTPYYGQVQIDERGFDSRTLEMWFNSQDRHDIWIGYYKHTKFRDK